MESDTITANFLFILFSCFFAIIQPGEVVNCAINSCSQYREMEFCLNIKLNIFREVSVVVSGEVQPTVSLLNIEKFKITNDLF